MDAEQFKKGLRDAEAAARRSGQQIKNNFTGEATRDIRNAEAAFRDFGVGMMAAAGAAAFGLYKTTQAASDLNEQVSQAGVVFKDASGQIEEFAKSADAIGLSERAATEAANSFGIMFTKMGKGTEEAAAMSVEFTKLAADLASFYNTSVEEATTALRSGLSGEMEPLKRYSIFLDDATLKQRAYDMGLTQTLTGTLPPLVKMQAAQAEALEQGNVAMGDAIRTSDGLAGRQRQLTADWENAQAALGEGLTPMLADAANGFSGLLEKVSEFNQATGGNAGVIAGYGAAFLGLAGAASFAVGSLRGMTENFGAAKTAMMNWTNGYPRVQALAGSLDKVAVGAGLAFAALQGIEALGKSTYKSINGVTEDGQRIADSLNKFAASGEVMGALEQDAAKLGASLELLQNEAYDSDVPFAELGEKIIGVGGAFDQAREEVSRYDDTLAEMARRDPEGARRTVDALRSAFGEFGITAETFDAQFDSVLGVLSDVDQGVTETTDSTDELTESTEDAAEAYKEFQSSIKDARKELEGQLNLQSDLVSLGAAYQASIDGLNESVKENGATFDIANDKGRQNMAALQEQTGAIFDNALAVYDQTHSMAKFNETIDVQREALRKQLVALTGSKDKAEELIRVLGLAEDQVVTSITMAGYDETMLKWLNLLDAQRNYWAMFDARFGGSGMSRAEIAGVLGRERSEQRRAAADGTRAVGGPVYAGVSYLVGETGPELVTMGANGHVSNSSKTSAMLNERGMGGGSETIQIMLDGRVLAEYLREYDRGRR